VSSEKNNNDHTHYEYITKFLLWALGVTGALIATIVSIAIYVSYKDRDSMREEYSNTIKDLRGQINDIKNEASETSKNIKSDLKDEVISTKKYSQNELERIHAQTSEVALSETKKEVGDIFKSDKIKDIIENQAINEIQTKVKDIVNKETENLSNINDAASEMRIGRKSGMYKLKSYFEGDYNVIDKLNAKKLYDRISNDYYNMTQFKTDDQDAVQNVFKDTSLLRKADLIFIHIINNHVPTDKEELSQLKKFMKEINNNEDLSEVARYIFYLSRLANVDFKPFQIEKINAWFNGLQK
jgi:hypothetical protein